MTAKDSTPQYLIRHRFPGTTNGEPVGDVYVTGPHFGGDIWSHTYDPDEAARFTKDEAEQQLARRSWGRHGGHPVPLQEAEHLKPSFYRDRDVKEAGA